MKAQGVVINTENDYATVLSKRSSACSACRDCSAKGSCHAELIFGEDNGEVKVSAINKAGANVGDLVELESDTFNTLIYAFLLFVLPFAVTISCYFLFKDLLCSVAYYPLILIAFYLLCFFIFGKAVNLFVKKRHAIYIVRVLEESKEYLEAE